VDANKIWTIAVVSVPQLTSELADSKADVPRFVDQPADDGDDVATHVVLASGRT